jgi:hypothetical protein
LRLPFLHAAVGVEPTDVSPWIVDILLVLDCGENSSVPGLIARKFLMYRLKFTSFQTIPDYLLAAEQG